jgi:hypothetical protein
MQEEIARLREQTERTRYQFLTVEVETCHTAIDIANFELSVGNAAVAVKEVQTVEEGIRVIHRFLAEISGDHRSAIEAKLATLQSRLVALKSALIPTDR